ncbi:methylenetetrahydromethanopterin dehydrogenase [candidate division MSBL1 archaeon SCGC-AAA261G05]|uniref:F420-dependent methylenetetrahydromethanopterin dehydrogenase n=2 Tax=candidate division MSBL1 TaxID=215777 RepID=A0A133V157_9EURY|nr:methylenetetrahydromethanopterin dehydrogenase [candidate division MSBL1 archaeon SCGC-AAA261C02]KXB03643.1 methylenetetrahydromethanopterin dehydrogenase [candidate division MSBL1 archaeon SCGC-AAA261G05]
MQKVRVGLVKLGNIGTSPMLDLMLDERAEREDIEFRSVSSGPRMGKEDSKDVAEKILEFNPDLITIISPNPTTPGPSSARDALSETGVPCTVVGDAPGTQITDDLEEAGFGYIFVIADSMIGARKEFLDPTEMALFNADLIKVLSITGALRAVRQEMDKAIESIKSSELYLPRIIVDRDTAAEAAGFENPYAKVKAMSAFEIASKVAELSVEGCFKVQDKEKYIPIVGSAHEMMRTAAQLADEARELEKSKDSVLRKPHADDGKTLSKRKFMETPK